MESYRRENCTIIIPTKEGIFFFQPDEIIRLQADSNYTVMHFINRKPMMVSRVLKSFLPLLEPQGFVRTHRTHLINQRYICRIDRNGQIVMQDDSRAEISRSKRNVVKQLQFQVNSLSFPYQ